MSGVLPIEITPADLFAFAGRVVFLTGAAGGFGRELAAGFARQGASLVLVDCELGPLESIRVALDSSRCLACVADVSDEAQVTAVVSHAQDRFGRIDVLVHVAGAAKLVPIAEMAAAEFDFTVGSHLRGTFLIVREVGRRMCVQGGGSIVLMSSIASQCALGRGTGAYAAAKAGVNALVRELAVEWAPHRVRVNAVAPCQFRTPGLQSVLTDSRLNPNGELEDKMIAAIPLGRLGEPREIVGPCLFLASDAASMVTGQVLFVDGGYTAR